MYLSHGKIPGYVVAHWQCISNDNSRVVYRCPRWVKIMWVQEDVLLHGKVLVSRDDETHPLTLPVPNLCPLSLINAHHDVVYYVTYRYQCS